MQWEWQQCKYGITHHLAMMLKETGSLLSQGGPRWCPGAFWNTGAPPWYFFYR